MNTIIKIVGMSIENLMLAGGFSAGIIAPAFFFGAGTAFGCSLFDGKKTDKTDKN